MNCSVFCAPKPINCFGSIYNFSIFHFSENDSLEFTPSLQWMKPNSLKLWDSPSFLLQTPKVALEDRVDGEKDLFKAIQLQTVSLLLGVGGNWNGLEVGRGNKIQEQPKEKDGQTLLLRESSPRLQCLRSLRAGLWLAACCLMLVGRAGAIWLIHYNFLLHSELICRLTLDNLSSFREKCHPKGSY